MKVGASFGGRGKAAAPYRVHTARTKQKQSPGGRLYIPVAGIHVHRHCHSTLLLYSTARSN